MSGFTGPGGPRLRSSRADPDWSPDAARTPAPGPPLDQVAELAEKYRGRWDIVRVDEGVSLVAVERLPNQQQPAIVLAETVAQLDRQLDSQ